jgi:hypothetical protein
MNSDNKAQSWNEAAADHQVPATEPTPAEAVQAVKDARDARPATDEPRPVPRRGDGWAISAGTDDRTRCYPNNKAYTWNAFAGVAIQGSDGQPVAAIELGGYNDLEMVDPYTCSRLWVADAFGDGATPQSIYDALRRLIDVAEREQFLG